ncbi:MAG: DUF2085 domain-containing protein [Anaerolineae bacterium]|nr:DUF2085 domain-containing protein [Anaerolineae bacterium]
MGDTPRSVTGRLAHRSVVLALGAVLLLVFLALPPHSIGEKAALIGYGLCHQEAERSYFVGGRQLPLCARDTGTYLGALATLACVAATRRRRGTELPPTALLVAYALGFVFFVVDGVNSYAGPLPLLPRLYPPDNRLRLLSGMLMGSGIAAILVPLFNYTVWMTAPRVRALSGPALAALPLALALSYISVVGAPSWMYLPLAGALAFGVLLVLSAVNGLLLLVILRQDQLGREWRDALYVLSWGLMLTAMELVALGVLRYFVERTVA